MIRSIKKFFNYYFSSKKEWIRQLSKLLGFRPVNVAIFLLAFKHSSKANKSHTSNERLEYLGDAILDAIISDYLFKKYPIRGEGFLTEMRSKIVNRKRLGEIGEKLNLKDFLDYDQAYVSINSTLLGNALEALIGAIYLDAGYAVCKKFVFEKMVYPHIDLDELHSADLNYKSRVFEWSQKYGRELTFDVIEEKILNKQRIFVVGAYIDGDVMGIGEGRSKKEAQKNASQEIYEKLNIEAEMEW